MKIVVAALALAFAATVLTLAAALMGWSGPGGVLSALGGNGHAPNWALMIAVPFAIYVVLFAALLALITFLRKPR